MSLQMESTAFLALGKPSCAPVRYEGGNSFAKDCVAPFPLAYEAPKDTAATYPCKLMIKIAGYTNTASRMRYVGSINKDNLETF